MSTIKIDRGFTQKIQHKELSHVPSPQPPPPKRPQGKLSKGVIFAVAGGVFLVAVIILGVVLSRKPETKVHPPAVAAQQASVARPARVPDESDNEPAEPAELTDLYDKYTNAVSVHPRSSTNQPDTHKRVLREVPKGSPHGLSCDYYEHITGKEVRLLRAAPTFPGQPSRTVQIGRFDLSENVGENYGVRVRGYLVPPKSGVYRFSVCADDTAEFCLSTDETTNHVRKLATVTGYVGKIWTERPEQQSEPCELVGGKRYYVEALMKQSQGNDYLFVGWTGPVSERYIVIDADYLLPWTDKQPQQEHAPSAPEARRTAKAAREAALAPARAAVAEQQRSNGAAYRFGEAARALKANATGRQSPEAQAIIDAAVLRYETLAKLRTFVQAELAKAPIRGIWVAFGGQADVTGASDEGVTVAPGRIVDWAKIPPDQMLRLVNATVPKAVADPNTKGTLLLAAAVFCKEVSGGLDLALKYRERAVTMNATLAQVADRALGGTPEAIVAQPRIEASRAELDRAAAAASGLAKKNAKLRADFSSVTGSIAGLNVDYWEKVSLSSLDEVRKQGLTKNTPPTSVARVADFATPENRGDKYVARLRGFLMPPETDDYTFYITADDQGEFWLSPDETPENQALCVKVDQPSKKGQWDKDKRKSKPVHLVKGRRYSVKGLLREGEKADHFAVAWSPASKDSPALITSENLVCESDDGLSSDAKDLRKKIEDDVQGVQTLAAEIGKLRDDADDAQDAAQSATAEMASAAQKQATRAKEAVHEAEGLLKRIESALPQLRTALRPESGKS